MPAQTDRVKQLRSEAGPNQIPYISKSRIKKFVTCPRKFYYSYIQGVPTKETDAMRRGTAVHEAFETYYENAVRYVRREGETPEDLVELLPEDTATWARYLDPYITNFIQWEEERLEAADSAAEWLPVAIEAEEWLEDPLDRGADAIPWMGYADVILNAASLPACEEDSGVVIIDFKTSDETPKEQYRDEGIYLEGEYYAMLFESEYDVAAVAGMYPAPGEMVISPLKESRRERIREVVNHIQDFRDRDDYEADEQPLCQYGVGEGCDFYGICSSTWGEAIKNEGNYEKLKEILSDPSAGATEIVREFGCSYGAANYVKMKHERGQL